MTTICAPVTCCAVSVCRANASADAQEMCVPSSLWIEHEAFGGAAKAQDARKVLARAGAMNAKIFIG